jgi:hypothetical protein
MPRKKPVHKFSIEQKQEQAIRHELRRQKEFSYSHKSALQKALTKAGF